MATPVDPNQRPVDRKTEQVESHDNESKQVSSGGPRLPSGIKKFLNFLWKLMLDFPASFVTHRLRKNKINAIINQNKNHLFGIRESAFRRVLSKLSLIQLNTIEPKLKNPHIFGILDFSDFEELKRQINNLTK